MSTCTLTGAALKERARALNIPGRSAMKANELRAAIDTATTETLIAAGVPFSSIPDPRDNSPQGDTAATLAAPTIPAPRPARVGCAITGEPDCKSRDCELHYMSAPLRLAPAPFRARNGKRKASRTRTHRPPARR